MNGMRFHLFTLARTPVSADPFFLILMAFFFFSNDSSYVVGFAFCLAVIVGVLVHEFGHVYAARTNGFSSQVILTGFGGVTIPSGAARGWREVWMSGAGPLAGFVLWGVLWIALVPPGVRELGERLDWRTDLEAIFRPQRLVYTAEDLGIGISGLDHFWAALCWVSLLWGIFNLLPIHPLDGGHIMDALLRMRMRALEATRASAIVSIATAVVAAFLLWKFQTIGALGMFLIFFLVMQNVQRLQR